MLRPTAAYGNLRVAHLCVMAISRELRLALELIVGMVVSSKVGRRNQDPQLAHFG